jgi:general secretion pathway protein G
MKIVLTGNKMFHTLRLRRPSRNLSRQAGFTLLELLVVLAILALLAGLVGPRVLEQLSGARADTAKIQIKNIEAALDLYRLDAGRYPSQAEGLQALIEKPAGVTKWRGPYLKSADGLLDPWGERYRYALEAGKSRFEILSLGADKAEGGDGENADIRN